MIRNTAWGALLLLTLLSGNPQSAIAREGKLQKTSAEGSASSPVTAPAASAPSPSTADALKPGREFKDCAACPPMIVVPSGQFVMGSPPTESGRADNEGPTHVVAIASAFAIGKYEITFDDWEACVTDRRCARADDSGFGRGRRPVINVSHENAQGYVTWLSEKTKQKYRLPTEAEWEYAARAGSDKARFWGNSEDATCQYANVFNAATRAKYKDVERKAFRCDDGFVETAPVGSLKPNKFGLYDMLGNVWEWVEDCWNGSYAGAPTDGSAWKAGDCSKRVLRGGGWYYGPNNARSAKRLKSEPGRQGNDVGFRIARTLP
jgi:formylglycine-generating enzyme required for sulfatase activity